MNPYVLYSSLDTKETYLECWGGSTKHPDVIYRFSDDFLLSPYFDKQDQVIPWLFECASRMTFPVHSYELAKWACEAYENIRGWK